MKRYKRLKLIRTFGPIFILILAVVIHNLIVFLMIVFVWIFIEQKFIESKLPQKYKRQDGEIFVIEPIKNTFFFGKVIRTEIPINDPIMNEAHLVYIFYQTFNPLDIPDYLDPNKLIIPPQIINNQGWKKGHFQTVGFQRVTNEELELNYGFWDIVTKKFVNEEGKEIDQMPIIYGDYGLTSYGSITDELRKIFYASN